MQTYRPQRLALALALAMVMAIGVGGIALHAGARPSAAQGAPTVQTRETDLGVVFTGSNGMTLYTFDRDTPGMSTCTDNCAMVWPPLLLPSGDPVAPAGVGGTLSVITRPDGGRQVAYNDRPLYFYAQDEQPGDTRGEGVGGVWFVARPVGGAAGGAAAPAAQQPAAAPDAAATPPLTMPRTGVGLTADRSLSISQGAALGVLVLGALGLAVMVRRHTARRA